MAGLRDNETQKRKVEMDTETQRGKATERHRGTQRHTEGHRGTQRDKEERVGTKRAKAGQREIERERETHRVTES